MSSAHPPECEWVGYSLLKQIEHIDRGVSSSLDAPVVLFIFRWNGRYLTKQFEESIYRCLVRSSFRQWSRCLGRRETPEMAETSS